MRNSISKSQTEHRSVMEFVTLSVIESLTSYHLSFSITLKRREIFEPSFKKKMMRGVIFVVLSVRDIYVY